MNTTVNPLSTLASSPASSVTTKNDADAADRFLKLLVAQMKNQDPLNPMDNAQVTTQMAQISTVSGIDKLNTTVQGLNQQFVQMQALQGASLVGRDVILPGDRLSVSDSGQPQGGFELASAADSVNVEVLNAAGHVIDTLKLGAEGAGRHGFDWAPRVGVDPAQADRFRIVARSGAAAVSATPLMRDRVDAVATGGDTLTLELRMSGSVAYSQIKAFN
jgi:flagellar basal-body rod modification protein FlgD